MNNPPTAVGGVARGILDAPQKRSACMDEQCIRPLRCYTKSRCGLVRIGVSFCQKGLFS